MTNNTQRCQRVVSDATFCILPALRGPRRRGRLAGWLKGDHRYFGVDRSSPIAPRSPRPLKRPIKVNADAVSRPTRVLLGQSKNERGGVAERQPLLADADAALRLAEEHHVGWKRKVAVIIQRVAAQEFRRLHDRVVAVGMSRPDDQNVVE